MGQRREHPGRAPVLGHGGAQPQPRQPAPRALHRHDRREAILPAGRPLRRQTPLHLQAAVPLNRGVHDPTSCLNRKGNKDKLN